MIFTWKFPDLRYTYMYEYNYGLLNHIWHTSIYCNYKHLISIDTNYNILLNQDKFNMFTKFFGLILYLSNDILWAILFDKICVLSASNRIWWISWLGTRLDLLQFMWSVYFRGCDAFRFASNSRQLWQDSKKNLYGVWSCITGMLWEEAPTFLHKKL